ncbi:hypothetical protein [Pseudomonas sp. 2822-17]|uniref:hypothetical protein n=1 Tax=Pseudomonas TaxID=286 RepID=UPI000C1610D6|nr:hypothetical protein [Pseudomonas sp. 2822-17]PIB66805.1 hypothetical protein AOA60_01300 [Pseudomonas sp. 2822-17]
MPNTLAIDTSVLITILGLIAAVWAVVPSSTRLRFRLGMSWFDWCIAIGVLLLVHYLVFEQAFRSVGLYYSFGPWKWGFEKSSAVYSLLLGLGLYILFRARTPKLAKGKIDTFEVLANNFLLTKRYDELFTLIEPHLFKLFKFAKHRSWLIRIVKKITPASPPSRLRMENGELHLCEAREGAVKSRLRSVLTRLDSKLSARDSLADKARGLLKTILNQPQFVAYLSVCHPYFCLKILSIPEVVREEFTELFVSALIADSNSLLYSELKNNRNLNGRYRLSLPRSNRILHFFFQDITTVDHLALYQPIGENVCRFIDEDQKLIEAYNRPLGYYEQIGKYRCPIYAGIKLFEIMIHEGIHQGIQDHLWLFYFTHFTDKILKQLRDQQPDDSIHEWPTPFHFLLYEIVSITSNWIDDCFEVNVSLVIDQISNEPSFDGHYISKQAGEALGTITQYILLSKKIDDRFKGYVLEISLGRLERFQDRKEAASVTHTFINSIIFVNGYAKEGYHQELYRIYKKLDHVLRHNVKSFDQAIEKCMQE